MSTNPTNRDPHKETTMTNTHAVNRPGFAGGSVSWFQRLRGPGSHGSW